ncbi:hypothetical protein IWQ60_005790 [Tieghemiomyces parasiticus]|uniref:Uncharacterized protein n=1 Tax=Tieghemiomyces parasiticus TaxID=78921 RepID=A0A9W8AB40_9FUNG|nr:hypothetical protein IWQ60_005790 [Tieghemiomyces parasiticus]
MPPLTAIGVRLATRQLNVIPQHQRRGLRTSLAVASRKHTIAIARRAPTPTYAKYDPFLDLVASADQETQATARESPPATTQRTPVIPGGIARPPGALRLDPGRGDDGERRWQAYRQLRCLHPNMPPENAVFRGLLRALVEHYRTRWIAQDPISIEPIVAVDRSLLHLSQADAVTRLRLVCNHWMVLRTRAQTAYLATLDPSLRDDPAYSTLMLPTPEDMEVMVEALSVADLPANAHEVIVKMREWYRQPTHRALAALLQTHRRRRNVPALLAVVKDMRTWGVGHTTETLRPVLLTLARANMLEPLEKVVKLTYEHVVDIDAAILTDAAGQFTQRGNEAAVEYLYKLIVYHMPHLTTPLLEAWFRAVGALKRSDLGLDLFRRMVHHQRPFNEPLFELVLGQLVDARNYAAISEIHDEYIRQGFDLTIGTWRAFLEAAAQRGDVNQINLLLAVPEGLFMLRSPFQANRIVSGLLNHKQVHSAVRFLDVWVPNDFFLPHSLCRQLLDEATLTEDAELIDFAKSLVRFTERIHYRLSAQRRRREQKINQGPLRQRRRHFKR